MESEYSKITIEITKKLSKTEKKNGGIFITPRTIIEKLLREVSKVSGKITNILEPSAGTCEIANRTAAQYPEAKIDAVEFNTTIYENVAETIESKNLRYIHADFTQWEPHTTYDLIIGNPPYVVCDKDDVPDKYREYCVGRPNLFCVFMLHSLSMLAPEGHLAFIIPTSFLNSAYYAKIRNYMKETGEIKMIMDFTGDNKFIETQQATIGLIYQKTVIHTPSECRHSITFNNNFIFAVDSDEIREILRGSTTLAKMGIKVKTGTIVWNQCKEKLTDDRSKTMLIYNTNIAGTNTVVAKDFSNDEKKQYIDIQGTTEPIIVVNRGNGNSSYKFSYAMVDGRVPYLIENHLNCIMCKNEDNAKQIMKSLTNKKTLEFVSVFLGNNGLSKTELETIFPIYLDM